jgi:EAL domain-containing protein (putative c-di-GMP-specific phosphodiesterase class I)
VAVNLSVRQFRQGGLQASVERALSESKLPPELLELEITESIAMQNFELTVPVLTQLSDMGVTITIDDFGTGYSSLSYLKQLPIHRLKIDKSFTDGIGIGDEKRDVAIVKAIIGMAHSLDLRVTAEGVETAAQLEVLRELECDEFQGYLCSPAVAEEDLPAMVIRNPRERWRSVVVAA